MKWRGQVREGVAARLRAHGLDRCAVCHSKALDVDEKPVLLVVGGAAWPNPPHSGPMDPDTQVDFMIRIECSLCGYNVLFNSERFYGGDMAGFDPEPAASALPAREGA